MSTNLYIPFPDWFVEVDRKIFDLINIKGANVFFDWLMPILRNPYLWIPLYLFLATFVLFNFNKKGLWWVLFFVCTAACTDLIGARIFKAGFERLRPCNDPEMTGLVRLVLGKCGGGFSFVSNHAMNHFGIAMFFFITFRSFLGYSWVFFIWATCIGYSQIYIGIHYPFDILFGALLGMGIGFISGNLFIKNFKFPIFDKESTVLYKWN